MNGPHWLDDPAHVKWLWRGFLVVLALTVGAEFFVPLHPQFEIESWFGFSAWYGLAVCIAMIAFAKALSFALRRPDTYYDINDGAADPRGDGIEAPPRGSVHHG